MRQSQDCQALLPLIQIAQGRIPNVRQIGVAQIRGSNQRSLPPALLGEVRMGSTGTQMWTRPPNASGRIPEQGGAWLTCLSLHVTKRRLDFDAERPGRLVP